MQVTAAALPIDEFCIHIEFFPQDITVMSGRVKCYTKVVTGVANEI